MAAVHTHARETSTHSERKCAREALPNNRPELLKFRNQLHATRGRIESYRMKLVDSPLDSPASFYNYS